MCIICKDELFSKLNDLEKINAYEELLFANYNGDATTEEAGHILDLLLDLKVKVYGMPTTI